MDVLVVSVLSGFSYGMVLFLLATGLSIVLGLMGVVNLAHGMLFMIGAYLGITVGNATGSFVLGIICGVVAAGISGLIIERGFLRRLYKQELEQILVTFGFIYIITNLHLWIYGPYPRSGIVPPLLKHAVTIGRYDVTFYRLAVIVVGALLCVCLYLLQEKTKIGAAIRAGMWTIRKWSTRRALTSRNVKSRLLYSYPFWRDLRVSWALPFSAASTLPPEEMSSSSPSRSASSAASVPCKARWSARFSSGSLRA